ncbi:MAG: hypothetical protein CMJ87_06705 [Planctomycetes bacterium]|nr:hypothetical protein [Planctomycetota bacterium]
MKNNAMASSLRYALSACALLALSHSASSQTVLFEATSPTLDDAFGWAVAFLDDLDGDGNQDWIVGCPGDDNGGADAGRALVYSGTSGVLLHTFQGAAPGRELGYAVAGAPDLDLDGVGEILVGAPGGGRVKVFSGVSGALLFEAQHPGRFGASVCAMGDWSGDGVADIAGGAPDAKTVYVYDGASGALVRSLTSGAYNMGHSVADIGDVDFDGVADLATGAPSWDGGGWLPDQGKLFVYSGAGGALLYTVDGSNEASELGWSLAGVGDMDGDGAGDFLVGSRGHGSLHCWEPGRVDLLSGASGSNLQRWDGSCDSMLGCSVAAAGDVDQDGVMDVLAGEAYRYRYMLYSGAAGSTLVTQDGSQNFGWAVAGGGDVNGDGYPDFIGSSPGGSVWPPYWSGTGKVQIMTVGCPADAATSYCPLTPNSVGPGASLYHQNSLSIAANNLRLVAVDLPPTQFGLFYYGPLASQIPFGEGNRCVAGGVYRLQVVSTGSGAASHLVDYASPPQASAQITPGSTWFFQFWYRDPVAAGVGYNLTDGLRLHFCP